MKTTLAGNSCVSCSNCTSNDSTYFGEADIGFMGVEASIYAYQESATDPAVNFALLTQKAENFLAAREEMSDFKWEDLKGNQNRPQH